VAGKNPVLRGCGSSNEGGFSFVGRGMIWLIYPNHRETWNYSFRILRVDEHCAMVEKRHNCTKIISAG
jgi:hypothetical protein